MKHFIWICCVNISHAPVERWHIPNMRIVHASWESWIYIHNSHIRIADLQIKIWILKLNWQTQTKLVCVKTNHNSYHLHIYWVKLLSVNVNPLRIDGISFVWRNNCNVSAIDASHSWYSKPFYESVKNVYLTMLWKCMMHEHRQEIGQ